MAETEVQDTAEHLKEVEDANAAQGVVNDGGSASKAADARQATAVASKPSSRGSTPALPSPGSGLVPLRGSSGTTSAPILSMPHPKRFTHVDINKRFLEKNSQLASTSHAPATSSAIKTASSIQKPALQTTPSHSKLVTAKLTADTPRSSTTGPGWSRPSSTSSSIAATPAVSSSAKPTPATTPATGHGAPLPVPTGKVIQPQPRTADSPAVLRKDGTNKPAWRSTPTTVVSAPRPDSVQNEFPTAAEVAQVQSTKLVEKKQIAEVAAAQKQVLAAEADAFRGVHLGPNVHHWDEDEGDDNNFLDEVIEFDDGRQYTIPQAKSPPPEEIQKASGLSEKQPESHNLPVSKEERFADDFDRSWPRSRNGFAHERNNQPLLSPSATSSQSLHSPQESSRQLFNERSNRLEPYSSYASSRLPGPPRDSYFGRRGSRSDAGPPPEFRGGRDAPPHSGIQLLQKPHNGHTGPPVDEAPMRSRIFGDGPGSHGPPDGSRFRDRDFAKRDGTFSGRPDYNRSRDFHHAPGMPPPIGMPDRPRRSSNMGPPPPSLGQEVRDGRQLPPHLSGAHPPADMWRTPSASGRSRRLSTASSISHGPSASATSPQASHASAVAVSPVVPEASLQPPIMDLEEARKQAMHSAAERARLRRQQEEEEREKERERARKKAAEIEAKLKAAEEEKKVEQSKAVEAQAVAIIEDAVRSVVLEQSSEAHLSKPLEMSPLVPPAQPRTLFGRPPSSKGSLRPGSERRLSMVTPLSPAAEAETWRKPVQSPVVPPSQPPPPASLPLFEQIDSFSVDVGGGDVEVVDFNEHGKLIGVEFPEVSEAQPEAAALLPSHKPTRPSAADFFYDTEPSPPKVAPLPPSKADEGPWRRKVSPVREHLTTQLERSPERLTLDISPTLYHANPTAPYHRPGHLHLEERDRQPREHGQYHPVQHHAALKSPSTPSYREAPMSALNDTMARIKGALDGMHKPAPNHKWLPPALRLRSSPSEQSPQHGPDEGFPHETFDVTGYEPPSSPKPAWNHYAVKLPQISSIREPIHFRRLRAFDSRQYIRLDILSLIPPREGGKRAFNMNELLFPRPSFVKGRPEYRISLPKPSRARVTENGLIVNLPTPICPPKSAESGAFGRRGEADGVSTWRRTGPLPLKGKETNETVHVNGLDTVSRSPPPEPSHTPAEVSASSPTVSVPPTKAKAPAKVPNGSGVAFYRDSRIETANSSPSAAVKFIVSSELEDELSAADRSRMELAVMATPAPQSAESTALVAYSERNVEVTATKTSKISSPWAPARDLTKEPSSSDAIQEQVKAIWSSKSNKTESPSQNLLDDLANDLAAVSFTAPETKLNEPSTQAPPIVNAPSRMSSQDVARAFQQVPNSSANQSSSAKASTLPPGPAAYNAFRDASVPWLSTIDDEFAKPDTLPACHGHQPCTAIYACVVASLSTSNVGSNATAAEWPAWDDAPRRLSVWPAAHALPATWRHADVRPTSAWYTG
ncbi:uncharacterized protein PHACADRAFT_155971 [Phanerochaete carnosa HHB-10118-sp]|uniref:Uncharacterized protein n=1 Tax=Phanerochaete carnosa (strain HHB-10118-sp) TaxID=650164 RepID=K5WAB4_PHACS|nr:uncharacterized protein PHACADRAFT_155971 [Phanerochaete carnosa HHB-10118-sp]EKM60853.1 hypothetical protein PHACADRAFT_155971 [Phanerochaete carnosa HHB-10118-sp]